MMRRMCGVSLKKHLSNEALRGRLCIDCVGYRIYRLSDLVRRSKLKWWFGHVERKDDQPWVRKCMDLMVGSAVRGRPRKSWLTCVKR